jgi:thiosulfate dehydrogenase
MVAGILAIAILLIANLSGKLKFANSSLVLAEINANGKWNPPDSNQIPHTAEGDLIRYGKRLIAHTSRFIGPKGSVASLSNGMNCQNCHLDAGARVFGNNYSAVNSTYPKFRDRSGTIENIYKRINDCVERSLHGKSLDTLSREMQAIRAYIVWLGQKVQKNIKPSGAGITDLPFLNQAADPEKGHFIYMQQCQRCHGQHGEGLLYPDSAEYVYPPLWGNQSYTSAAGLHRITRLAGYVKDNMPFGASTHFNPQLTDTESWDVAAFIISQPRPEIKFEKDWPDKFRKPIDYPYGPYMDSFSERQHQYGPFIPILAFRKRLAGTKP